MTPSQGRGRRLTAEDDKELRRALAVELERPGVEHQSRAQERKAA